MAKRFLDILLSVLLLVISFPLIIVVALLILVRDGSPILFAQERVGVDGVTFWLLKFRTMSVATRDQRNNFGAGDVSRVTDLGRILRKTKLDELPQLVNVLRGDMSLVGPRPEVSQWVAEYPERWALVHTVKPGITDPASIKYRNEEELLRHAENPTDYYRNIVLPEKLDLYEEYVRQRSFLGDITILFRTIKALFQ